MFKGTNRSRKGGDVGTIQAHYAQIMQFMKERLWDMSNVVASFSRQEKKCPQSAVECFNVFVIRK